MTNHDYKAALDKLREMADRKYLVAKGYEDSEVDEYDKGYLDGIHIAHNTVKELLTVLEHALKLADKLMKEPTSLMQDAGSGNQQFRGKGWKTPLTGMRPSSTIYDDKERATNCFKAMRDQMLREVE